MSSRESTRDTRVYIGNLPPDIRSKDIEDLFYKYGTITFVDLKTRRGPPFAFVEFKDPRDAKDAVHARDGYDYDGYRLRVEFPRGRERGPGGVFKNGRERREREGGRGGGGGGEGGRGGGGPTRRSNYRVKVTGLPPTGSWQDLKDHMREAGDVCYADVFRDGSGVVEFLRHDDMKYAMKKLDDSRFRSHEGEVSYIRVAEDSSNGRSYSRSRSRSPRPGRSRSSPTYSPRRSREDRDRDRSRSRSRSSEDDRDSRDASSRSRSRSRSPVNGDRGRRGSESRSRSRSHTTNNNSSSNNHNNKSKSQSVSRSRSPSSDRDSRSRSQSRSRSRSGSRD